MTVAESERMTRVFSPAEPRFEIAATGIDAPGDGELELICKTQLGDFKNFQSFNNSNNNQFALE